MITIVLADDHKVVRQGLRALLRDEEDLNIVGEASDGIEAVQVVERLKPDILLTDLSMPGLNGIEVTTRVCEVSPKTKVIILSMHGTEAYVRQALEAGAKGYVIKDSGIEHVVRAIHEATVSGCYLSPPLPASLIVYRKA